MLATSLRTVYTISEWFCQENRATVSGIGSVSGICNVAKEENTYGEEKIL